MNCSECRSLLSDLLDEELAPAREGQVREHCEECSACGSELRQLSLAIEALRTAPRDEPPPRLAGRILQALPVPLEVAAGEAAAARPVVLRRKWSFLPWGTAAAALILAAMACLWAEQARRDGASKAAELGERLLREHAREVKRLVAEKASLAAELESSREAIEEIRESSRATSLDRESKEKTLRRELESLDARLALQTDRIRELEDSLHLARDETRRVRGELDAAVLALARAESPETPPETPGKEEPGPAATEPASTGGEHLASLQAEAPESASRARIRFRRRGDLLQMEMTGPRKELIPELFRIAGDGTDDAQANLALNALEGLLGGREPASAPEIESRNTPAGIWNRGVGFLASGMGFGDSREGSPSAAGADRRQRLRRLEERWREAGSGSQSAEK